MGTECDVKLICPNRLIQRWTAAVWLVQAWDGDPPAGIVSSRFTDVDSTLWWAPYVERLAELRITRGCAREPVRYCPDQAVTRAQMASFLARMFWLEPAPEVGYQDIDGNPHAGNINAVTVANFAHPCTTNPTLFCPHQTMTRGQMATHLARALGYTLPAPPAIPLERFMSWTASTSPPSITQELQPGTQLPTTLPTPTY